MALTAAYGGPKWSERTAAFREDMPRRTPYRIVEVLRRRSFRFVEITDGQEAQHCLPMNFVALRPGEILMPQGRELMRALYEGAGVICHMAQISESIKAGVGIHCMTGCHKRDPVI